MLTKQQLKNTREELQENYRRLGEDEDQVLKDLQISSEELHAILNLKSNSDPYPGDVWMTRDYLEDKLTEKGIPMKPFTRLANHSDNHWFSYNTPWRK